MRVVYWNIRAGGGVRVAGIADQLRRWRPDVVGLSEFRGTAAGLDLAARLADQGLRHQLSAADPRQPARNAVFLAAQAPLRRIHLRRAPLEPGRWLAARTAAGPTVGVMHAPNYVTGRKQDFFESVLALTGAWRGGPAMIGGDTNTGVPPLDGPPPAFHDWEAEWIARLAAQGWADAFRTRHPRTAAPTWYSPNRQTGYRLDQVFLNRPLHGLVRSVRYRWGTTRPPGQRRDALSDHAALLLDLAI